MSKSVQNSLEPDFSIFFSQAKVTKTSENGIVIYLNPAENPFDDFGHNLLYDLTAFSAGNSVLDAPRFTKVLPIGLKQKLTNSPNPITVDEIDIPFLSQINGHSADDLFSTFGLPVACKILEKLNDASSLRTLDPTNPKLKIINEHKDEFFESLIREGSALSFYNGSVPIFNVPIVKRPSVRDYSFQLDGFSAPHTLKIDFKKNELFDGRMIALIGENGVGKSQALSNIAKVECQAFSEEKLAFDFSRVVVFSNAPNDPLPRPNQLTGIAPFFYKYTNLILERHSYGLSELIFNIAQVGRERVDNFRNALSVDIEFQDVFLAVTNECPDGIRFATNGPRYLSMSEYASMREGKKLAAASFMDLSKDVYFTRDDTGTERKLSTGQRAFVALVSQLVLHVSENSLVLIDEPEAFLHPNLMVNLFKAMAQTMKSTKSFCIFSTHSIYMVRELVSSQVRVFKFSGSDDDNHNYVTISQPTIVTFGASLDLISDYIFGDMDQTKFFQDIVDSSSEGTLKSGRRLLGEDARLYATQKTMEPDLEDSDDEKN